MRPAASTSQAVAVVEAAAVRSGPLRPWMKAFAEWHASQPGRITKVDLWHMACELSSAALRQKDVQLLVNRDDWMQYREEIALDLLLQSRKRLERRTGDYVDAHYEALQAARKNVKDDPMTVAKISEPVLDRVWPKREDRAVTTQTIVVNLTAPANQPDPLEYEPLPVEIVRSDDTGAEP